jgi:hypothetical protein
MIKRITLKAGCLATEANNMVSLYDVDECSLLDAVVENFDITRIKQHYCFVKGPVEVVTSEDFKTS